MSSELSPGQNFTLGTIAALLEGVILQPTVYWKTAKAQRLPFTLDPRLLFRGTGASLLNECQMMGIQFGLTGHFQRHISKFVGHSDKHSFLKFLSGHEELLSAAFGGCFAALFASPVELVMIQQQLYGGRLLDVPRRICQQFGFGKWGIMRALGMTAVRDTIYVCGMLGVTPVAQLYLEHKYGFEHTSSIISASVVGGVVAAVPSHPFDVIKTCMQGDLQQKEYGSAWKTTVKLWEQGGLRRIFAGCVWRTVNIVATVYMANLCMKHGHDFAASIPI